jgi:hypothetical protein
VRAGNNRHHESQNKDRHECFFPNSISAQTLPCISKGRSHILSDRVLKQKHQTPVWALLRSQQARARNLDSLRSCLVGGDVCPLQLQEEFSAAFGVPLRSVWASTEAIACLTYGLEPGPIFRVASGTEIRLVNDHHAPVAIGEIG